MFLRLEWRFGQALFFGLPAETPSWDHSEVNERRVQVSSLSGTSNFLEFEASGAVGLSDELLPAPPLEIDLEVNHYDQELRPFFQMLAQQIAMCPLPEGDSFSFNMAMADTEGMPEITLE